MKKTLGIIGGLGPMASAQFMELLTAMTAADTDQAHIEAILWSRPSTPDRTAFLLGRSQEDPFPAMRETGLRLESLGAQVLAIPCMTAHSFYDRLRAAFSAELLNPITGCAELLRSRGMTKVGIMATDGTLEVGLFQHALSDAGITPVTPDEANQHEVMRMIYDQVKSGRAVDLEAFHAVAHSMRVKGAECIILGCTELSVIKQTLEIGAGFLDAMEVLAAMAVTACGYETKRRELVS
jgi:aspartate racemase